MTKVKNLSVGGLSFEIIRKKKLKNIYVRVYPPDGKIIISSPFDVSDEYLKMFVLKDFSKNLSNISKNRIVTR